MINLNYNGKSFNQRESDSYVNLGELCATHGKRFNNWSRTKAAKESLEALAEILIESGTQIRAPHELVVSEPDSIGGDAGTWGHPLVAIEVARWINPRFGVWCNQHIKRLIETGSTTLANTPVQGLTENLNRHHDALLDKLSEQQRILEKISSQLESNTSADGHSEEKPWTPPPLYPEMTKEFWDSLPPHEKHYYSESKEQRENRVVNEINEVFRNRSK